MAELKNDLLLRANRWVNWGRRHLGLGQLTRNTHGVSS